jgi:hypothetical protein
MANYVYIEDGVIKEYHDRLPNSWKNVSGFKHLASNIPVLISYGWYPVEKNHSAIDPTDGYISEYTYEILSDKVIETTVIHYFSQAEKDENVLTDRLNFFNVLRQIRNDKIGETDWTQTVDLQQTKSETWKNLWKDYRQALRDLPQDLENTTNYNISDVVWPDKPAE